MTFNIPLYDNLNNDIKGLIDSHILYDLISVDTRSNQDILLFELKAVMDLTPWLWSEPSLAMTSS